MFVVTGGGRGLGHALACALAKRDQPVLIIGRNKATLQATANLSSNIEYFCADVSLSAERTHVANHLKNVPVIQGLIHNAGIIEPIMPVAEVDEGGWRACMATNVEAPLFLTQLLKDKLQQGRVLHIGSGAAHFPIWGWAAYCVSKAALAMLTRCWQLESTSIAFASVMPGIIDTDMQAVIRHAEHMDSEKLDFFKQLKATTRLVTPETVASFLCWLLLDIPKQKYISQEWDIYDKTHHLAWLKPPHVVPEFE